MRIAITADIHVGVPGRLNDIMWALIKIRQHCIDNGIKYIVILGDLLHDREQVRVEDLNALVSFLIDTDEKFNIKIITFPGNHDMYLKNSWDINSIKPLTRYLESHHRVSKIILEDTRFWIVPFIHYESDYMKVMDSINKKHQEGDILLTHIGVKNAVLNACFLLKSWSVVDFTDSPFERIYAGHFHLTQQVGKVWYPGSPIPFKFDEGDSAHGFFVYDTKLKTHEFVNLLASNDEYKPPQFKTIDDASIDSLDEAMIRGNIIRVALGHDYTNNQLSELRKTLHNLGAKDVRWMNLASKDEKETVAAVSTTVAAASQLFGRFLETGAEDLHGLSKSLLIKLNVDIMADADRRYLEVE